MHSYRMCHGFGLLISPHLVEAIGAEVMPLKQKLEIIDASNHIMEIIGTPKMYIENHVLRGKKCVEAAVTRSNKKETLISLSLLKKWDLVHDSFPRQTISEYVYNIQRNKNLKAYLALYDFNAGIYEEHSPLKPPSSK